MARGGAAARSRLQKLSAGRSARNCSRVSRRRPTTSAAVARAARRTFELKAAREQVEQVGGQGRGIGKRAQRQHPQLAPARWPARDIEQRLFQPAGRYGGGRHPAGDSDCLLHHGVVRVSQRAPQGGCPRGRQLPDADGWRRRHRHRISHDAQRIRARAGRVVAGHHIGQHLLDGDAARERSQPLLKPGALVGVDISAPEAHADRPGERVAPLGMSRGHPPGRVLQLFV